MDVVEYNVSRDFTCYLCNGVVCLLGYVRIQPSLIQLFRHDGYMLEEISYSHFVSVTDEEPPTYHSLMLNLTHRSIYISFLLRKDRLVKYFQELHIFKENVRFPSKEFGFYGGKTVLRKLFGEHVDNVPTKSAHNLGASGWKERKAMYTDPRCHRCSSHTEGMDEVQLTHTDSDSGGCKSCVTSVYGGADDLSVYSNNNSNPMSVKNSRVHSDNEASAVISYSNVDLKPKRNSSKQNRSVEAQLANLVTLFPHCSKSELCLTLERAGNDFGVAVAAILGENNMANCLVDYENTTNQQPGMNEY